MSKSFVTRISTPDIHARQIELIARVVKLDYPTVPAIKGLRNALGQFQPNGGAASESLRHFRNGLRNGVVRL